MKLTTTAFTPGEDIPKPFTCDGSDISPALAWTSPPAGTQAFALIMDDPDAPGRTWVHWVLYDLPAPTRELTESIAHGGTIRTGGHQGRNDFGKLGYGGPCPPRGPAHRYYFRLHALDEKLGLEPGASRADVDRAMRGHILASAELMGRYRRA